MNVDVAGRCPACGGVSLFLGSGGYIKCSRGDCPNPSAASDVLDLDHRHVVELSNSGWSVEHPATCRTNGKRLLDCAIHRRVDKACEDGPPYRLGRYSVEMAGARLSWLAVPLEEVSL